MLYCPLPYADELFPSILTRAARHTGRSYSSVLKALSVEIGRQQTLDHSAAFLGLATRLGVPESQVLESHTFFPYTTAYLPADHRERYACWVLNAHEDSAYTQLSHLAKFPPPPWNKRFCIQCVSNDRKDLGEAYWHRQHHLPGMTTCPIHRIPLSACARGKSASDAMSLPSDYAATKATAPEASDLATTLTRLSLDALSGTLVQLDYSSALRDLGYTIPLSLAGSSAFTQAVLDAAGTVMLEEMACTGSERLSRLWPAHVAMGRPTSFPTQKHLVVHAYLKAVSSQLLTPNR
ncbi:TniQ family protein [Cupriavidus necator]|uniref:TniQ domain-containing protein n=1 Tax=Cupriavidus necator TaxID=106590 RepID=A0A367PH86_CUPNE|nr:TniQ family protein [Cupriavidus necator]QQX86695.1 TniQ family protein [Cupriavidus necator]RCJ07229.1 hypothetical protein DDK22_17625 [Cupriavidus necator]